jgi:hypothetical protein
MEKKHAVRIGIAALAAAAALGAGVFLTTHIRVDGAFFSKDVAVLDLTDHDLTVQEYQDICGRFPDKQVLWTVPFQGSRYCADTKTVTVSSLTEEDVLALDHLTQLQQVDATHCTDYEMLVQLQLRRPECQVLYKVPLGDVRCSSMDTEVSLTDASAEAILQALPLLPRLKTVYLEGTLPSAEELLQLRSTFPSVEFRFTLTLGGHSFSSDAETLDLAGASVTLAELEQAISLLPHVSEVNLLDSTLTDSELKELAGSFPEVFFLCTMEFAGKPFRTDSTEIDITGCITTVEEVEALLPFFPDLTWLDMSWCSIEDEAMDALNRRYPDIKILWSMQIGLVTLRTDAIYFFPAIINEMNLPSNEELKKLRFCTDMIAIDIGHSKATECEWVEYMPHLKFLILADTKITDISPLSSLKELIYLELFSMDLHDYSPLLECTALQDLNISSTYADPEPLTKMTWLHTLMWNFVMEDPVLAEKAVLLPEQLPDTNVIIQTWRNIGGLWRHIPNYYVFRDIIGGDFFNQTHTSTYWGNSDANRIMSCDGGNARFAGEVLRDMVRFRIDNGLPIPGIKNIGSEKAEILYQSLCEACQYQ